MCRRASLRRREERKRKRDEEKKADEEADAKKAKEAAASANEAKKPTHSVKEVAKNEVGNAKVEDGDVTMEDVTTEVCLIAPITFFFLSVRLQTSSSGMNQHDSALSQQHPRLTVTSTSHIPVMQTLIALIFRTHWSELKTRCQTRMKKCGTERSFNVWEV